MNTETTRPTSLKSAIKTSTDIALPPPISNQSRNTIHFAPSEPNAPADSDLHYDHNKILHSDFFRISGLIGMQDLINSSFTTEHISSKAFKKKIESIHKILEASDYQEQASDNTWTLPTMKEIAKLTLAEHTSSSPYQNKADHQTVKRFCAKILATPPENCPSYNNTTHRFDQPMWWEWLYLGLYSYLGPTALKIRREGKKLDKKEKQDAKIDTTNKTGLAKNPYVKPKLDKATRTFTFVDVTFPHQDKFDTWKEKQPIISNLFTDITTHLFDRVPNIGIHKMIVASNMNTKVPPVFHDTPSDSYPTNQGKLNNYISQLFLQKSGNSPKGRMLLSHTGLKASTIEALNTADLDEEEQKGTFQFKESAIQAPEITEICWMLGTNEYTNKDHFLKALNQQTPIQDLLSEGILIDAIKKFVQVSTFEPYDENNRHIAKHIVTDIKHVIPVLTALQTIYHPQKKINFPLDIKCNVVINTSSPYVTTNEESKKIARKARAAAIRSAQLKHRPIQLYNVIHDLHLPLHEDGPDLNRLILSFKHPKFDETIFKAVSQSEENPGLVQFTTLKSETYISLANEIVSRLGMIAQKHCGPTAWKAFTPEYRDIQESTYTYDEAKGVYLSKMDRIQGQLPNFNLEDNPDDDDNSLSSIEDVDKSFCVIEHLSIEMLNSYRIRTATRTPGGPDSASSVGGIRPSPMSTCSTRAGGSFGQSIVVDDDTDMESRDASITSLYSTSELPGYPPELQLSWCAQDTLPELLPTIDLLFNLAKSSSSKWTKTFQDAYDKWAPGANLSKPQSWTLNEKRNLIWYSFQFYQRNNQEHTAEEFFQKGGPRWVDHIFRFWWRYFTNPEAPQLDKTLPLPPQWIFEEEEYDILEYFSHSGIWKDTYIPYKDMMPSLLITAYCTVGPCDAKCPYIPYYKIVIDGGPHQIVHLANTIRQKFEENEDTTNTPITLISWKAQLETWEKTSTEDLWINESM